MKLVRKILISLTIIFLGLLITFNFYNLFCLKVLNKDLTTISGYAVLEVVSGSMEPTIHVGDLIIIHTNEEKYKVGDIITFYDVDGSFVTHRIISIENGQMITQGDNNNSPDSPTDMKQIVGKYIFKITGLGILFKALKSPVVMILVLLIGIMVCFLISTDKDGKPILNKEEEEFQKYLQEKNKKDIQKNQNFFLIKNRLLNLWNMVSNKALTLYKTIVLKIEKSYQKPKKKNSKNVMKKNTNSKPAKKNPTKKNTKKKSNGTVKKSSTTSKKSNKKKSETSNKGNKTKKV